MEIIENLEEISKTWAWTTRVPLTCGYDWSSGGICTGTHFWIWYLVWFADQLYHSFPTLTSLYNWLTIIYQQFWQSQTSIQHRLAPNQTAYELSNRDSHSFLAFLMAVLTSILNKSVIIYYRTVLQVNHLRLDHFITYFWLHWVKKETGLSISRQAQYVILGLWLLIVSFWQMFTIWFSGCLFYLVIIILVTWIFIFYSGLHLSLCIFC